MAFTKSLEDDFRENTGKRKEIRSRANSQIKTSGDRYRAWYDREVRDRRDPVSILAEGDSWFLYMAGRGVIDFLEQKLDQKILNLAFPGDEVGGMMVGEQRARLVDELKAGPSLKSRKKFEFLLFSGGGNDMVGAETFYKWLKPWKREWNDPRKAINRKTLDAMLAILEIGYQDVIDIRDEHSPDTVLVFHGYDFAQPNGKGVCSLGPWLQPGLVERKIPKRFHAEVVKLFLERFNRWLKQFAANNDKVMIIPTQGTLKKDDWANELHPTNSGFSKIAKRFLLGMFGPGAPGDSRIRLTADGRVRRRVRRAGSSILGTV